MPIMKNQIPEMKVTAPKRLSPELDEILHMLKSLESNGNAAEGSPYRR
jgi:hypothetical protein